MFSYKRSVSAYILCRPYIFKLIVYVQSKCMESITEVGGALQEATEEMVASQLRSATRSRVADQDFPMAGLEEPGVPFSRYPD